MIRPGDIVQLSNGGDRILAFVEATVREGAPRGRLKVRAVRNAQPRTVRVSEVTGHWRKAPRR